MKNKIKAILTESAWDKPFDKKQNEIYGWIGITCLCLGWMLIVLGYWYIDIPVMIIGGFISMLGTTTIIIAVIVRGIRWIKEG
jgi:fatty acid desaturase